MKPTYEPADVEANWYDVWQDAGAFRPETNPDGEPFSIVIPPPNVTGVLHIGHALNHSIQDVIIRRKRMQGYATLWLPGTDHAGIATQNVVERELAREGLNRHDLGREDFVARVWEWKEQSGGDIQSQIRTMGMSTDWSRERFTLDEGLSVAVREVFVTLYEQGLIYRGNRIINWCPRCHTALSDIEVEYEDEAGELVSIRYPFADSDTSGASARDSAQGEGAQGSGAPDEGIVVATTRPETMLGDSGIAVHPDDPRYAGLIGRHVVLPLVGRTIPIVADAAVEMEFGTGAVKVTPAHDPLDFEIGERHDLPQIVVIELDGTIAAAGGEFAGLDRYEARRRIKERLESEGALVSIEKHDHSVGHCSRCSTVVEPLLSMQWFVKVDGLAGPAMDVIASDVRDDGGTLDAHVAGTTRFVPTRWEKSYFHWMENLRDWCISRQLWWGHRIPAWYCDACDSVTVAREDVTACPDCGGAVRPDEDVLDTWFSSALWPFSTLGWPGARTPEGDDNDSDLARFYPTDVLVTGFDIIYFWVARMLMMGLHFMNETPFDDIVIHGLVRASDGAKMSKSRGNTVDPLEMAADHGADAVRLALLQAAAPGQDIPLDEDWVVAARRFGNKLWNAVRFAVGHSAVSNVPATGGYPADPGPVDAWILHRLGEVTTAYDRYLDEYRFSDAVSLLYNFAWSEVFDWYIEMAKLGLRGSEAEAATTRATLGVVMRDVLAMFHPVIPFVTEELWSELGDGSLLITKAWPTPPTVAEPEGIDALIGMVTEIRRFRAEHNLGRKRIEVRLDEATGQGDGERVSVPWWRDQLGALGIVDVTAEGPPDEPAGHARLTAGSVSLPVSVWVPLADIVDVAVERPRLEKAIAATTALFEKSTDMLANPNFVERAPAAAVEKERAKLAEFEATLEKLRTQLAQIG